MNESWQSWLDFVKIHYKINKLNGFFCTNKKDPRPYLNVKIFDINLFGLLDSGASQTIIGERGWQKLQILNLRLETNRCKVTVANGYPCEVLGSVNLPIELSGRIQVIKALVILEIDLDIILGIDFWEDMNIITNFSDNSWYFGNTQNESVSLISNMTYLYSLSTEESSQLNKLISDFFSKMGTELGCAKGVSHIMDTGDNTPIKQRYYPVSPYIQEKINVEIEKLLKLGVIEPSKSAWPSPIVMVKKPNNEYRFCIDFRKVNQVTKKDAYPLPYINSILDPLRDACVLSSIDLKSAYHQIPLAESS